MTDKPARTELWAGCDSNDPKPRMKGRIPMGGMDFNTSPTDGLEPAKGRKVDNIKHVKGE